MTEMSNALTFFLNYSNSLSILTILTCLIVMVVFIVRLNAEQIITTFGWNTFVQHKAMIGIHNPFVLKLFNPEESSLKDDVSCLITACCLCRVQGYWGLDINNTHWSIRQKEDKLIEECKDNVLFNDSHLSKSEPTLLSNVNNHKFELKNPGLLPSDLGLVPRAKYPLVIVVSRESDENVSTDDSDTVVAIISIIHLRDEVCPGASHIVTQYVKTKKGKLCTLQQLYTMSDSNSVEEDSMNECIICTEKPVTQVILPCRHACVCALCFTKLDKCPVCRGVLDSFFTIGEQEEEDSSDGGSVGEQDESNNLVQNQNRNLLERFQEWNNRLNQWLGFT